MAAAADRQEDMFPKFSDDQIQIVARYGKRHSVAKGQHLFEIGDGETPFFVILSGCLEISQPGEDGEESVIVRHGPGEFTGEINLLSSRRSLVRGAMSEPGDVLELSREAFRKMLGENADLSEVLMRAFILRRISLIRSGQGNVVILGSRHSAETLRLRQFLSRNGHPFRYIDIEDAQATETLERLGVSKNDIPIALCRGGKLLKKPSNREIANCLGLSEYHEDVLRDVIVIGAGPAGLAAAVYAASEGLTVMVAEEEAYGGQAGSSSKIENYLGFPTGISGQALAGRAFTQAQKFGAEIVTPLRATGLECGKRPYGVRMDDGSEVLTHAIVIATGARYKKLNLPNLEKFEGRGIYYGATHVEALLCDSAEVAVVGGGNSAGQAAVFLSRRAKHVHMLVRGEALSDTMSSYLAHRIGAEPNITLYTCTEVIALTGDEELASVVWKNRKTGEEMAHPIEHIFVMIGADPNTAWLDGCLALDEKGFVKTGAELEGGDLSSRRGDRQPYSLETSRPGIFAAGDVRSRSVKRVASAVGEGSVCVQYLHAFLGEEI
jgi:thioredoxin reductase (NADPH)